MKIKILIFLLFVMHLHSKSLDTYVINLSHIDSARYTKEKKIQIVLDEKYWESFFNFTRNHLSQKISIRIDTMQMEPHIYSPLYSSLQFSPVNPKKFSKGFKALLERKTNKTTSINNEKVFLEKMLKKHDNDFFIATELIRLYHQENTEDSSKQCIKVYENATKKTKEKIRSLSYHKVFDCYMDLNKTTKTLGLLAHVKKETKHNYLYEVLEKEAYVYTVMHQPIKAKQLYVEAVAQLKKANFLIDIADPDQSIAKRMETIRQSEIKRLEKAMLDL